MKSSTVVLGIAVFVVLAIAVVIHLYGPQLGRAIHGAR
jgi:hypothetical protein